MAQYENSDGELVYADEPDRDTPVFIPPPPRVPTFPAPPPLASFLSAEFVTVVGASLAVPFVIGAASYWWQLGGSLGLETWALASVPAAVFGACVARLLP